MSLSVTENRNQTGFNPLKWGLYGAGGGVVARSLLPITEGEKANFSQMPAERKQAVRKRVDAELAELRAALTSAPADERAGYDMYLKFANPELDKAARPQIEKDAALLPEAAKKKFFALKKHVDKAVVDTKKSYDFIVRSVIKESRSLPLFTTVGALSAAGVAFVGLALSKMSDKS